MIKNTLYTGDVKIEKERDNRPAKWSCENMNHVDNVNVAQGPRTGNRGMPDKRMEFVDAKESRVPLSDMVNDAFAARGRDRAEYIDKADQVGDNVNVKYKKKK
jgi:hypothetical protein